LADAVRDVDARVGAGADAAHWMAILAMDQHAELIASHADSTPRRFVPVTTLAEAGRVARAGGVGVLAPSGWLRSADPLSHSWDVTSDSIAAWVAGEAGARQLVLVKPPGATGTLTDAYFSRALPSDITCEVVTGDDLGRLRETLSAAATGEKST
jgi:aspartokinase-like uncharacterized kinase